MPLNSPTHKEQKKNIEGKLYVVATPIGNPDDITLRAIRTLGEVDYIAAEDTRKTGKLLSYHNIKGRLISYHEHNEASRSLDLIEKIKNGSMIALVSDAGTPGISDPGYRLVQAALKSNIQLVPVPGVSAAITALSISGLPTDSFRFVGFLPKKAAKRREKLEKLSNEAGTILFYESPKRIVQLINEITDIMGDRLGVLSREMTKTFEEFIRGRMSEIAESLAKRDTVKGECTLLVSGSIQPGNIDFENILEGLEEEITKKLEEHRITPSVLAREISEDHGLPKKMVYERILAIKRKGKGALNE